MCIDNIHISHIHCILKSIIPLSTKLSDAACTTENIIEFILPSKTEFRPNS